MMYSSVPTLRILLDIPANILHLQSNFPERCLSGRKSTPGKCVYLKRVSRVRIPPSPQSKILEHRESLQINNCRLFLVNNNYEINIVLERNSYTNITITATLRVIIFRKKIQLYLRNSKVAYIFAT